MAYLTCQLSFSEAAAARALSNTSGSDLGEALDYLCLHTGEAELKKAFRGGGENGGSSGGSGGKGRKVLASSVDGGSGGSSAGPTIEVRPLFFALVTRMSSKLSVSLW